MRTPARGLALAVVIGLASVALVPDASPQDTTQPYTQWWGPTEIGSGFHVRVPVTIENAHGYPVKNGLVLAEVDIVEKLVEQGWIHETRSDRDLLSSFELDPDSVRVVEMTNLDAFAPGNFKDGLVVEYDGGPFPEGDTRRFEVPSAHFTGLASEDEGKAEHDPKTRPSITVMWRVSDQLEPGDQRYYMIYFDSLTNRDAEHIKGDYRDTRGAGLLQDAFGSGPGTDLIGVMNPLRNDRIGNLQVLGLHDGTTAHVQVASPGGRFNDFDAPFSLDEGQSHILPISTTKHFVRVFADKPVLALADSEGSIPATDGDLVGNEFLFAMTYPDAFGQDSLFFLNMHPKILEDPATDEAGTLVRVESLDANGNPVSSRDIHLSDTTSAYRYTLGARGTTPDSDCQFPQTPSNPEFSRGVYRATVIEGGPVAIQHQPVQGTTPVMGMRGVLSHEHWSVLSRSSAVMENGDCRRQTEPYLVYAMSPTDTFLQVRSPEAPDSRLFPGCPPADCPGAPLGEEVERFQIAVQNLDDRPLQFRTQDPSFLWIGAGDEQPLQDLPMRGPLPAMDASRQFAGTGSTTLYAPFANTRVQATIDYQSADGVQRTLPLVKDNLVSLPVRSDDDRIRSYVLQADRPILVLPDQISSGLFAGPPPTLSAQIHDAEYRGYLVDIASTTGFNPVTRSTVPGQTVTYSFIVTNRGHEAGGKALEDTIEVCPSQPKLVGWQVSVQGSKSCDAPASFRLASGASKEVTLTVTPSDEATTGDQEGIIVKATSRNSFQGKVFDTVAAITQIKSAYDVGLWFDVAKTAKSKEGIVNSPGDTETYTLILRNEGTVEDTIRVTRSAPDPGWTVLIDGQTAVDKRLGPIGSADSTTSLSLTVTAPADEQIKEGFLSTIVTATSTASAAAFDKVTATTTLSAPSLLVLEADETTRWIRAGKETVFNLTLRNEGDGTAQAVFDVPHDDLPGWSTPTLFAWNLQTGQRVPLLDGSLAISPGDTVHLGVNITAAGNATAGERNALQFLVSTQTPGTGGQAFLYAIVLPRHDIQVTPPDLPILVDDASGTVPVPVHLSNDGNLVEQVNVSIESMPAGWSLTLPAEEILLPIDHAQILNAQILVPVGVEEGMYDVALRLTSQDGNRTPIHLPFHVGAFANYTLTIPKTIAAQPGQVVPVPVRITNHGNTPVVFFAEDHEAEPWTHVAGEAIRIPAGAHGTLRLDWTVPRDVRDGITAHTFGLSGHPDDPTVGILRSIKQVEIDVGRADLHVVGARGFKGAAGTVVQTTIVNDGVRPAHDVVVGLSVAEETIDQTVVTVISPGDERNITLLLPEGIVGTPTIIVDPYDAVVETDEADNVFDIGATADSARAPAMSPAIILLAATLIVLWRRVR